MNYLFKVLEKLWHIKELQNCWEGLVKKKCTALEKNQKHNEEFL